MQEVVIGKYLKEGIVYDRTDIIILSRNLNCTSAETEPKEIKKRRKKKEKECTLLEKQKAFESWRPP